MHEGFDSHKQTEGSADSSRPDNDGNLQSILDSSPEEKMHFDDLVKGIGSGETNITNLIPEFAEIYIGNFAIEMLNNGKHWPEIIEGLKVRGASLEQVKKVLANSEMLCEVVGKKSQKLLKLRTTGNKYIGEVEWKVDKGSR